MATAGAGVRGEQAGRPWEIPGRGWKDVLLRVWKEIGKDNLSIVAAGVAFYAMFAVFPAIAALVTLYGLVTDPAEAQRQMEPLREVVPQGAFDILLQQTTSVASQASGALSFGLILGLALAIWSATKGTKALITALNIAYEETETRGFFRLNLVSLALTVGAILFVLVLLAGIAAVPAILAFVGEQGGVLETILLLARWLVIALLMMLALAVVYRYAPSRATPRFQWVSVGAVVATVLWLLGSFAFSLYVRNFDSYDKTFGSLGAVAVLLMWFYISAYVVCLGAELNAELERQTQRDSTTGPEKPIGQRGAFVADHKIEPQTDPETRRRTE